MTNDEIISKISQIYSLKKQIKSLQLQRKNDEIALNIQYKVDECNQAKNTMASNYQNQISDLCNKIYMIEDELGT